MTEYKAAVSGEAEATWRQFLSYLFRQDTTGVTTDGVMGGLAVAQTTTASSAVLIGLGSAVVQDSLLNGVSPLISNAVKTLDVLTANPMGATPRNDLIVFDAATVSLAVIVGVPNAVPTDPTVPATAVPLARLRHAASATTIPAAKIDDLRVVTSLTRDRKVTVAVQSGSLTLNTGWQNAVLLATTPGKWMIRAEGQLDYAVAAAGRQYTVSINSGGSTVFLSAVHQAQSTTGKQFMYLAVEMTVTVPGTIAIQVKMDVGGGASLFYGGRMFAEPIDY